MGLAGPSIAPRGLFAAALGLLSGCLSPFPSHLGKTDSPAFEPEKFFAGETRGEGTLVTLTGSQRSLRVAGRGHTALDGSFQLDQTITFSNGDTETRTGRLLQRARGSTTRH